MRSRCADGAQCGTRGRDARTSSRVRSSATRNPQARPIRAGGSKTVVGGGDARAESVWRMTSTCEEHVALLFSYPLPRKLSSRGSRSARVCDSSNSRRCLAARAAAVSETPPLTDRGWRAPSDATKTSSHEPSLFETARDTLARAVASWSTPTATQWATRRPRRRGPRASWKLSGRPRPSRSRRSKGFKGTRKPRRRRPSRVCRASARCHDRTRRLRGRCRLERRRRRRRGRRRASQGCGCVERGWGCVR